MTSRPDWGEKTSALEVAKAYAEQIKQRNVLITGVAPSGVGEGTALAFASQGPKTLILVSRTPEKVEAVAASARALYPDVRVRVVIMDLSSQASIRRAAAEVAEQVDALDVLVNNAGATYRLRRRTAEGIEMQFGANHVGPFLFTALLFPLLRRAAAENAPGATRIVNLASHGHRCSPIRFHDYNVENKEGLVLPEEERPPAFLTGPFAKVQDDGYMSVVAYGQSKTANILFTLYLQRHLKDTGIVSYAVHPGGVKTHLGREHDEETAAAIEKTSAYWKTPDEGASTSLVAALDPKLSGLYLADCQFVDAAAHAQNYEVAERLWKLSEELAGEKFTIG
ncbi:hypothetical protein SLS62_005333 [Diatrype stigma]|uniref:Uncharacterized protein n=1 Tax=Diatrype stigma TaxID=117547 RepID=A0AAN9YPU9_9PEZI